MAERNQEMQNVSGTSGCMSVAKLLDRVSSWGNAVGLCWTFDFDRTDCCRVIGCVPLDTFYLPFL